MDRECIKTNENKDIKYLLCIAIIIKPTQDKCCYLSHTLQIMQHAANLTQQDFEFCISFMRQST
jgi:hypothetical protein